jgi:hypothetical protein
MRSIQKPDLQIERLIRTYKKGSVDYIKQALSIKESESKRTDTITRLSRAIQSEID